MFSPLAVGAGILYLVTCIVVVVWRGSAPPFPRTIRSITAVGIAVSGALVLAVAVPATAPITSVAAIAVSAGVVMGFGVAVATRHDKEQ